MSVAGFLKDYRRQKGISQQSLAIALAVSHMTITRLESGEQAKLTTRMADKIAALLDEYDIKELDSADPEEAKILKSYHCLNRATLAIKRGELEKEIMRNFKEDLMKHVEQLLARLGFEKYQPASVGNLFGCGEFYINPETKKVWVVNACEERPKTKKPFFEDFFCCLGKLQTIKQINKYSFAVPNSMVEILKELDDVTICNPLCDISVLHYSDDGTVDGELDVALLKDGRGVFDLDEQDPDKCAQAMADYTRWKLSITKAVLESD